MEHNWVMEEVVDLRGRSGAFPPSWRGRRWPRNISVWRCRWFWRWVCSDGSACTALKREEGEGGGGGGVVEDVCVKYDTIKLDSIFQNVKMLSSARTIQHSGQFLVNVQLKIEPIFGLLLINFSTSFDWFLSTFEAVFGASFGKFLINFWSTFNSKLNRFFKNCRSTFHRFLTVFCLRLRRSLVQVLVNY